MAGVLRPVVSETVCEKLAWRGVVVWEHEGLCLCTQSVLGRWNTSDSMASELNLMAERERYRALTFDNRLGRYRLRC